MGYGSHLLLEVLGQGGQLRGVRGGQGLGFSLQERERRGEKKLLARTIGLTYCRRGRDARG